MLAIAGVAVALMVVVLLARSGGPEAPRQPLPPPAVRRPEGLPAQANRLLGGGPPAFRAQLAALRGTPVVVNQWASWCGPCRFEFPFFQRLAARYRGRVAFLGVNAQDSRGAARRFLREYPTPYPHFFDPSTAISREFRGGFAWPTTAFYDARGKLTRSHAGGYASQARLDRDIRAFALHG